MGQAARERAHQHVAKAKQRGGCTREGGAACRICRHPPAQRDGDVIDFERLGWLDKWHDDDRRRVRRNRLALLGAVLAFGLALVARCTR